MVWYVESWSKSVFTRFLGFERSLPSHVLLGEAIAPSLEQSKVHIETGVMLIGHNVVFPLLVQPRQLARLCTAGRSISPLPQLLRFALRTDLV